MLNLAKEEFNNLCIRIMGYKDFDLDLLYDRDFNPYDNLNHMEDVFNKLLEDKTSVSTNLLIDNELGIKYAMRNFILKSLEAIL